MLSREQTVVRDLVMNRFKHFKLDGIIKKYQIKKMNQTVEDIVNIMDHDIDMDDLSVTIFDEVTSAISDYALEMGFGKYKFLVCKIADACCLPDYNYKVNASTLITSIDWKLIKLAFEKEGIK